MANIHIVKDGEVPLTARQVIEAIVSEADQHINISDEISVTPAADAIMELMDRLGIKFVPTEGDERFLRPD